MQLFIFKILNSYKSPLIQKIRWKNVSFNNLSTVNLMVSQSFL